MEEQVVPVRMDDLWPNQERAFGEVIRLIMDGARRICVAGCCGSGKSRLMERLIQHFSNLGMRSVLYTNRRKLRAQLSRGFTRSGIAHGVRASGEATDFDCPVQISSMQTENARVFKTKNWDSLHSCHLVLVDEAHCCKGDVATKLQHAHLDEGSIWIGFTATPLDIGDMYDHLVMAGQPSEMRKVGAIVPAIIYSPDEPDCKDMKRTKTGEFVDGEIVKAIMSPTIFGRVLSEWNRLNPEQKPTILFAPGVGESLWFAEQFYYPEKRTIPELRSLPSISAAHIDGNEAWINGETMKSDQDAMDRIEAGCKSGEIKVVSNRFVLREGIDWTFLEFGILATMFGTLQTYLQAVGRIGRACPENPSKTCFILQDHGGNFMRLGSPNADRDWVLGMTAAKEAALREDRLREKKEREPITCVACKAVRASGPKCPLCGHESHQKTRVVVQRDGTLKQVHGDAYKPRFTKSEPNTEQLWKSMYFRARKSRNELTFRAAMGLFAHENHYWPPRTLPFMPKNDNDFFRKVIDVPYTDLTK